MRRLWQDNRHEAIVRRFRELGYVYVAVDLAGFQSGSGNLVLPQDSVAPAKPALGQE
jgi:PP-loop superfamily ATP-utilizing enzyme